MTDREGPDDRTRAGEEREGIPAVGRWIGPYRLLEEIGRGGMGEVWLAEQVDPIHRRVAIKIIRPGLGSREFIARFESERQALALMSHPGIARVFDAGETPEGLPYLVMEYVAGIPITEYCDQHRLSTRARIDLLIKVCDAIQHAHQRGILHRDIKPGNVLVVEEDSRVEPKVIDFGLAKALVLGPTEQTFFTQRGAFLGTPGYMSPEQAEASGTDVDTRTDVYSLGVLLYEMLVGTPPLDTRALREAGLEEIRRRIRELEPPRPSVRIGAAGPDSTAVALRRSADLPSLLRQIRGDLDWIAMRALEKEPSRRYGSAFELAADLRRHLNHEPVVARPPSRVYKLQRFIRRHRLGTIAVSVIALSVIAGTVATALALVRALRAEKVARQEAQTSARVTTFMRDLFKVSDPGESRGSTLTVREVLDRGADRVDKELAGQPDIRGRLLLTLGAVYINLGELTRAEELMLKCLALYRSELSSDKARLAVALNQLAWLYYLRNEFPKALPLVKESIAVQEADPHRDDATLATALHTLASIEDKSGDHAQAVKLFERTLALREKSFGEQSIEVARSLNSIGVVYMAMGDYAHAQSYYERALATASRTVGEDHPNALMWLNNLGSMHADLGHYEEAAKLHLKCLTLRERVLGPQHPDVAQSLGNLGNCYVGLKRFADAVPVYRREAEIMRKAYGEKNVDYAVALSNLGDVLIDTGGEKEARGLLANTIEICEANPGNGDVTLGYALNSLARLDTQQRRFAAAETTIAHALSLRERLDGRRSWTYAMSLATEGQLRVAEGKKQAAIPIYEESLRTLKAVVGSTHPDVLSIEKTLAVITAGPSRN